MKPIFKLLVIPMLAAGLLIPPSQAFSQKGRTGKAPLIVVAQNKKNRVAEKGVVPVPGGRIVNLQRSSKTKRRPSSRYRLTSLGLKRKLSSRSAIIIDSRSGEIIYSHEAGAASQPASTIKILTGLIAIKSLEDKDLIPVSRRAAGMPRSKIYIRAGKSYCVDDMINAVLLSSANDASVAVAEKVAGSERVFAKLMTYKAKVWGADNTVCKTATGLTARGQKSTVRDLARLFNHAMETPEFSERMALVRTKTSYGKTLYNHNKALWQIEGAEGGKTGYTRAARQTYVGKFKRGEDEITIAILGSETMWGDIENLVEYGFEKKQRSRSLLAVARKATEDVKVDRPLRLEYPSQALQVVTGKNKFSRM